MSAFFGLNHALRQLRIERGMTQAQLARAAGISRAAVQAYESGRRKPKVATLERLLDSMGARLPELVERMGRAFGEPSFRKRRVRRPGPRPSSPEPRGARPDRAGRAARGPELIPSGFQGFLSSLADLVEQAGGS